MGLSVRGILKHATDMLYMLLYNTFMLPYKVPNTFYLTKKKSLPRFVKLLPEKYDR